MNGEILKVLTYHNVDTPPKQAKFKTLYVKPSKFERQMGTLKTLNKTDTLITFDDGYKDFLENAFPVIKKYNLKATVFIVTDLVGSFNVWDYQKLNIKKYLMDWKDIEYISKGGVEIGSHTLTHPFLTKIDKKQAKREIEHSKKKIEDKIGMEVKSFCYPYGDYDQDIKSLVIEAGYSYGFTTVDGSSNFEEDRFEIKRITVFGNMLLPKFLLKVIF